MKHLLARNDSGKPWRRAAFCLLLCLGAWVTSETGAHAILPQPDPTPVPELCPRVPDNEIWFPATPVGKQSPVREFRIGNCGTAPLTITEFRYGGNDPDDFIILSDTGETVLAPGASRTLQLQFRPRVQTTRTAALYVHSSSVVDSTRVFTLIGEGVKPLGLTLSDSRLWFGNQLVGIRSAARTLTITNRADQPLSLQSLSVFGRSAADFLITSDSGETTLAPGASRTLTLQCRPLTEGSLAAALTVRDTAGGEPQELSLGAWGVTTFVHRSPRDVSFGEVPVGVTAEQEVTIRNDGHTPLRIATIWIGAHGPNGFTGANFYWKSTASLPITLIPGASTILTVGCKPGEIGAATARLHLFDDAPFSPHLVSLSATAVAPLVALEPGVLEFHKRLYGGPATVKEFSIRNPTGAPLTIHNLQISGPHAGDFAILSDTGQQPLAHGDTRRLGIQFKPRGLGSRQAVITVTHSAPRSPQQVLLQGEGVSTFVHRFPNSLDFGAWTVGTTREKVVTIRNDNVDALLIVDPTRTAIVGTNPGEFYWRPTNSFNAWMAQGGLPYGQTVDIIVGFRPRSTGSKAAVLAIFDNAPYSPHNVPLTGSGN